MKRIGGLRTVGVVLLLLTLLPAQAQEGRLPAWERPLYSPGLHPAISEQLPDLEAAPVYRLDWTLESNTLLSAHQQAMVTNCSGEPWNELYFLLLPNQVGGRMTVDNLRLDGEPVRPRFEEENVVLRIDLPARLEPGEAVTVDLDYSLEIPESGGGNYGILAFNDGVLSLAHAYALLAVYDEEGWDTDLPPRYGDLVYALSSFFRVRLDAPASIAVASSGRRIDWDLEGGRQLIEFAAGPVRDFYLAAGEEFEQVVQIEDGVTVRGYALPGTRVLMESAVETAVRSLALYGELYGHYPYRELDVVPISTSALGVEFPGIIALRRELIEDEEPEPVLLESTVAHEVAHQWFYSLVGNDQVSEPWLDESVTQYLTLRYYLELHGESGYRLFREGLLDRWEQIGRKRLPIGLPVGGYSGSEYGAIIYGLGPLVVERLAGKMGGMTRETPAEKMGEKMGAGTREKMGQPAFDEFMHDYVARNAFEIATTGEFRELAEAHCECSLAEFFQEWVFPTQPASR